MDDYNDLYEQYAYLTGQLLGNATAIAQGNTEMGIGLSGLAGSVATGPGVIVAAPAAAIAAAHGASVIAIATAEEIRVGVLISNMVANGYNGGSEGDEESVSSGDGDNTSTLLETQGTNLYKRATNSKLKRQIECLWKDAKIGSGSTGDMIRAEIKTGIKTSASGSHLEKGRIGIESMRKLLKGS